MRSVINILQNDSALTTLLGGANQIGMNTIGQTKKTPYVVVDLEDIDLTNAFNEESGVDFERITIFSVGALAFSSGSIVGADEISKAVKKALNFVTPGTYDGEVITRCTFERGLQMQEDRVANKPQITKEDEYLLVVRSPPVALPANLSAILFGVTVIDLTWVDGTAGDFDFYAIERSLELNSGFVQIDTTTNATSYRDLTITETDALTYFYRVRASKDGEFSTYSNIDFTNTIDLNLDLDLQANDLSTLTLSGFDVITIADKSDTGADFTQGTPAQRPLVDSVTVPTKITTVAANSETLTNTGNVAKFAVMSQGSISYIASTTTNAQQSFSIANSASSAGYFHCGMNGLNPLLSIVNPNGTFKSQLLTVDPITLKDVVEWSCNGIIISCKINGLPVALNINLGVNEGDWTTNSPSLDIMAIGSIQDQSPAFQSMVHKALQIRGNPLTAFESQRSANELIARHNL